MPPKRKHGRDLPANLYPNFDKRSGVMYYRYKDLRTGTTHSMGTDKESAIKDADLLNIAIYGKLAYSKRERIYLDATPDERAKPLKLRTPRYKVTNKIRFEIFNRDNFTCRYCGRSSPQVQLEVDHVHPIALGGSNELSNLATACTECNSGKSDRTIYRETVQA